MKEADFKAWLQAQQYAANSIATYLSDARKVDRAYDLDLQFERDGGAAMLAELAYSKADEAAGRPNPSRLEHSTSLYANFVSYRAAARVYLRFRAATFRPQGRAGELDRQAVLDAVAACDAAGSLADYLAGLDLGAPTKYWLVLGGKRYPSKAIVRDALARSGSDWLPGGGECKDALDRLGFVVVDWPELQRARNHFLREMPGFTHFGAEEGAYWDIERRYKNELIAKAQATIAEDIDDRTVGERIYRSLAAGQAGVPLSWRTLSDVQNADEAVRGRFYATLGELARSEASGEEAIAAAARELEALRTAGLTAMRRGEVLSIPITVWATLHPKEAGWFKIAKVEEVGQRFFGRRLFRSDVFREEDLAEWLQLMRALFDLLDREFGWQPRDMFDVQGFFWVVIDYRSDEAAATDPVPVWMVTSLWGREDGLPRFVERQEWSLLTDTGSANNRRVREMQVGDRIFLKDFVPRARDLPFDAGRGIVTANRFRAEGTITEVSADGLRVGVDWQAWDEPRIWLFYTNNDAVWRLKDPGEDAFADRLRRFLLEGEAQDIEWFLDAGWRERLHGAAGRGADEIKEANLEPTNLILFGPPGTGKTYRTAREAVRLCDGAADYQETSEGRAMLMARYRDLVDAGQVELVTFHQSFSYEEFVEGLRPDTESSDASGGFKLKAESGLFYRIAERAQRKVRRGAGQISLAGRTIYKMSLGQANEPGSAWVFEDSIEQGYAIFGFRDVDWSDARFASRDAILAELQARFPDERITAQMGMVKSTDQFCNQLRIGDIIVAGLSP